MLFNPAPEQLSSSVASYMFTLQPNECRSIYITVRCDHGAAIDTPPPFRKSLRAAFDAHKDASRGAATVISSNQIFNEVLCRSMADLRMLTTDTPQGPYPYAGIPWYSTTVRPRRDHHRAADACGCDSAYCHAVCCGASLPIRPPEFDPLADAEPGKILHEMRGGEMATLREVPFGLYYGSVDATPLFVMLAGLLHQAYRGYRNAARAVAQHRSGTSAGSTGLATAIVTGSSNISDARPRG